MDATDCDTAFRILREGETCQRIARADRAAVLVEASSYFDALRRALLRARHRVVICGWDVDGRTRLVGPEGKADDGAPETLRDFLSYLVKRRPDLRIDVLLWDFTTLYALDREAFPALNLGWRTPEGVCLTLDNTLPVEASQHQKIVVIDDSLAFCGGTDLSVRRWDTSDHLADNPLRRDPLGEPYEPYHDIMMMVDGAAARALAEIAYERLRLARRGGVQDDPARQPADPELWPATVVPDFREVAIGIALTRPPLGGLPELRQVEALYCRSIGMAERLIYMESQYLTATVIADALIRRLSEKPELEVVIVGPLSNHGWIERHTMAVGRAAFMRRLADSGVGDRVAVVTPVVDGDVPVMVHAKLLIVDDVLMRIGSSNLNNRSMGLDSECDLVIEAGRDDMRPTIAGFRNALLAEHLDVGVEQVARALDSGESAIAMIQELGKGPRGLRAVDAEGLAIVEPKELQSLLEVADPDRPISVSGILEPSDFGGRSKNDKGRIGPLLARHGAGAAVLVACVALALAWQQTPLAEATQIENVRAWLDTWLGQPWAPFVVLGMFVGLGLLVFPVTVLIAATAALFGPWLGFACALTGSLASAVVAYGLGTCAGRRLLRYTPGKSAERISKALGRHGVIAIVVLRLLPIAPFTLINLLAGASHVSFRDFVLGTVIGMTPGIAVMSALGSSLGELWRSPGAETMAWVAAVVLLAGMWTWIVRRFLARRARSQES